MFMYPFSAPTSGLPIPIIAGSAAAAIVILIISLVVILLCRRHAKNKGSMKELYRGSEIWQSRKAIFHYQ